ncbi:MAG: hypothetical protein IPP29_18235 [Bacteroidetes bacterium]|nr:hypothetical protein [Bacteroidota bacterium]
MRENGGQSCVSYGFAQGRDGFTKLAEAVLDVIENGNNKFSLFTIGT